ncbi:DUF1365 family protein, partial [Arthrospira platensis SPKY1]|nr:DUF1365 family protein [Arthrospira platensis SPKY1]
MLHRRTAPRQYQFTNRMFMFMLDLDELPLVLEQVPLISHNQRNLYSFRDDDHLYLGYDTLRANVEAYLRQQGVQEHPRRIELVTQLRCFGYVFNPVSFYVCRNSEDKAFAILAQVHNRSEERR